MADRFEELRTYVAIVDAGGVNAAAATSGIAKSADSRRLSAMEARLGVTLVDRSTRRFELTEFGRTVHEESGRILAALSRLDASAKAPSEAAALTLALAGAGLVQLPTHVCRGAIEEGRLVRLLAKQEPPQVPVHVTWAEGSRPA